MRTLTIWSVFVAAIAMAAGCSASPTSTPPAASAPAGGSQAPATQAAAAEMEKPFGSTFSWPSGAQVTVSVPTPMKPAEFGSPQPAATEEVVAVDVTYVNGSDKPVNPVMVMLQGRTGDTDAKPYFDASIVPATSDVLPGKTAKWKAAYVRTKGAPFTMQVGVGFDNKGYYK